jgi:hypothetical protein
MKRATTAPSSRLAKVSRSATETMVAAVAVECAATVSEPVAGLAVSPLAWTEPSAGLVPAPTLALHWTVSGWPVRLATSNDALRG